MNMDNNNQSNPPGGQGPGDQPHKDSGTFSQEVRHQPVSARVPEKVARGVISTGVLVLDSPNEFLLDFMQGLTRPFQVVSRIVLTPMVMEQFVHAVRDNLNKYEQRFGPPPTLPKPPTDRRPTLQEIYDEFKLPDELMSGQYANAVMVGHSPSEFFFDFITNFFPTSAVSSRVFLSTAQVPRLLETMTMAIQRYHQRMASMQQQQRYAHPPQLNPPQLNPPPPGPQPLPPRVEEPPPPGPQQPPSPENS
jgi:hypothetical protein